MIDRERVLAKLDPLDGYLTELRSILVHQYGNVLGDLVYETISRRLGDFAEFRRQIIAALPA